MLWETNTKILKRFNQMSVFFRFGVVEERLNSIVPDQFPISEIVTQILRHQVILFLPLNPFSFDLIKSLGKNDFMYHCPFCLSSVCLHLLKYNSLS